MFSSVTRRFDGCTGFLAFVPSFFETSMPLMYTRIFFRSTSSTFPCLFLNWPLMTFTLSPFLMFMLLLLYFFLSSFERWALTSFCLMCNGALCLYFLCFLGCTLLFHEIANFVFMSSNYTTMLAIFATPGQRSVTSFAIAPLNIVPFGFPLSSFKTTAALSSNFILVPSALLYSFFCLTIIANTVSFFVPGLPRLTEAMTKSETPAEEMRPFVVFRPTTVNILSTLAPELSQVSTSLPTGNALVTLAFMAFILLYPLPIL